MVIDIGNSVLVALMLSYVYIVDAFTVVSSQRSFADMDGISFGIAINSQSSALSASTSGNGNKKRRRRKQIPQVEDSSSLEFDDLPEFDLDEDEEESKSEGKTSTKVASMEETVEDVMNDPAVMAAMMRGSSMMSSSSTKDVLKSRDRALEATFEFDDVSNPLPRPGNIQKDKTSLVSDGSNSGISKKQAKREARVAAALAAKEEEESINPLDSISSIFSQKASDGGFPKIVEVGTWVGIGVLVAWEAYINSPFFERAQPMIPVVYDFVLPLN